MHLCITDLALVFSVAEYNEGDYNNNMSSHSQNTIENTKT